MNWKMPLMLHAVSSIHCGNDEVYLEKVSPSGSSCRSPDCGDTHGNIVHLFERDCTVQRRNQKVVERAPAQYLSESQRHELCEVALTLARAVKLHSCRTVEFLMDADTDDSISLEIHPRIQVEHTSLKKLQGLIL